MNLGGVTDSYQPAERDYRLMPRCSNCWRGLRCPCLSARNPAYILRDIELLKSVNEAGGLMSAFTITTMDNTVARLLTRAPPPHERMAAIKEIKKKGIYLRRASYAHYTRI